jgi:arylsulfatase
MSDRPHVLLICTDHWPGSHLGIEGHPALETPTIDELARGGVRFTRAYSECPVCIPARRTLMTGTSPRRHGDRTFQETLAMPRLALLAQAFRDAGYQAYAAGKLHVYPQRDRIGFDDVILVEEGREQFGVVDDYELALGDRGFAGRLFEHGLSNNQYVTRPWHLPEELHNTTWIASQMERQIKRRDPTRPGFWFLSFAHPHPPLAPLDCYLRMYDEAEIPEPAIGGWARDPAAMPYKLRENHERGRSLTPAMIRRARRAFYALCTHIDHQIRRVIGALREEGLLADTVIMLTSDHGDMLGDHGLWAKRCFLEGAARVPLVASGPVVRQRMGSGVADNRLAALADVMPTLLDLCGLPIPETVEGLSLAGERRRSLLYGEEGEGVSANRMVHDGRHKLIYYPCGNRAQLFDLDEDPAEMRDLSASPAHRDLRERLTERLTAELYGSDLEWVRDGALVGLPDREVSPVPPPGLAGQRGSHWPPPPATGLAVEV